MKTLRVLAMVISTALTLITACQRPLKRTEFKELVPDRAEEMVKAVKESPAFILVTVDGEHRVFLNDGIVGTTEDVSLLKEKLAQALERSKAYRGVSENRSPGATEEADRNVVFVRAPSSLKYGDVVKVIEAIKGVGGEPIGLQENPAPDR